MTARTVHVGELHLRASGLTREQARRLGELVAARLAESGLASSQAPQNIPSIDLAVRSSGSLERTADDIAARLRQELRRA
jgi:hypothetical protein